jgi:hypothetical protein
VGRCSFVSGAFPAPLLMLIQLLIPGQESEKERDQTIKNGRRKIFGEEMIEKSLNHLIIFSFDRDRV